MTLRLFIPMTLLGTVFAAPVAGRCQTPPTYIGVAYGSSNSVGPVTINVPPGTKNGDLMLAYIATQTPDGAWITAPAGWTQATKTFNSSQGSQLFWRVANNEPAAYTWSGTSYPQGAIRTYRDADATAPIASTAGCTSAGGVSCQIPAIPEWSVAGELYVLFWDFNLVAEPIYAPAGLSNYHWNLTQRSMISADKALTVVGATTIPAETATVRGAPSHWDGIGVTIQPAGASASQTGITAVSANDFLISLGVNIGPSQNSSVSQYTAMINYIGVRNVRGSSLRNNAAYVIPLAQATNTKFIYSLGSGWSGTTSSLATEVTEAKKLASAGVLLALEGANETDNWTVTYNGVVGGRANSWLPVAQLQRDWCAAVKADTVLKNYPVYTSSHVGGEIDNVGVQFLTIPAGSGTLMPDGTKYGDFANMHNYVIWAGQRGMVDNTAWNAASPLTCCAQPGGNGTTASWYQLQQDFGVTWRRHFNGYTPAQLLTLPRVTTETGWTSTYGAETQAKVMLNVYLAQFKRGYAKTFWYQLKDNEGGFTNNFGVFNTSNNPKLAATYIHNLTAILSDNRSVSPTPGVLNYSIPNEPATVHDLLLRKSTGAFELVVWDERPVGTATDHVTVNLGGSHTTVKIYDVTVGAAPVQTLANVSSVPLTMTDHPMIIEVIN